jgi:5-methylcytosine-specific restriction endonuclease McrA
MRNGKSRQRFKATLLARDGRCLVCGKRVDESTINPHHVQTKGAGGEDSPENGISLCQACHVAVHNGHITPAALRWILVLTYGYEYQDWELGDAEDRLAAEEILATYTFQPGAIF